MVPEPLSSTMGALCSVSAMLAVASWPYGAQGETDVSSCVGRMRALKALLEVIKVRGLRAGVERGGSFVCLVVSGLLMLERFASPEISGTRL